MNQREIDEWHEKVHNKGFRFLIRDDIEEIIKEEHIDRTRFHEFSKINYEKIIKKFFYAFSDRKNYFASQISPPNHLMYFRPELQAEKIDNFFRTYNWSEYLKSVRNAVPDFEKKLFLILSEGWVYEGHIDEMFNVLRNITYITDFYIVSNKFDWFIAVNDMEDYAAIYK